MLYGHVSRLGIGTLVCNHHNQRAVWISLKLVPPVLAAGPLAPAPAPVSGPGWSGLMYGEAGGCLRSNLHNNNTPPFNAD